MKPYLNLLQNILDNGHDHEDRTGVGRRSIFGTQSRFDLSDNKLPLVTTQQLNLSAIVDELLWFIRGETNIATLGSAVNFWKKWSINDEAIQRYMQITLPHLSEEERKSLKYTQLVEQVSKNFSGEIGPMYGAMWRNAPGNSLPYPSHLHSYKEEDIPSDKLQEFRQEYDEIVTAAFKDDPGAAMPFEDYISNEYQKTVDQLGLLVSNLKKRPYSSRHLVTAWVPSMTPTEEIDPQLNALSGRGALGACHAMFQCFVSPPAKEGQKKRLSLQLYQRSMDTPVGGSVNIAQYSMLTHLLAHVTGMQAHEFIHTVGDAHIYFNQIELVKTQLQREPLGEATIEIRQDATDLFALQSSDIQIHGYQCHERIRYPVAV